MDPSRHGIQMQVAEFRLVGFAVPFAIVDAFSNGHLCYYCTTLLGRGGFIQSSPTPDRRLPNAEIRPIHSPFVTTIDKPFSRSQISKLLHYHCSTQRSVRNHQRAFLTTHKRRFPRLKQNVATLYTQYLYQV